ncbi:MAG TPA: class I SAM-dependent methyltransferase [Thermoplasmata archaeon]|nr:class I SAM-dependent methyltransferase [Thermoplasmata archaeon]
MVAVRLAAHPQVTEGEAGLLHLRVLEPGGTWSAEVPLRFVRSSGDPEILAAAEGVPRWAHALVTGGKAIWRVDGTTTQGDADGIEDPQELETILGRFAATLGTAEVRRWFPGRVRGFRLRSTSAIEPSYPLTVEAYFDRLAPEYDRTVETNPLDRDLRDVSNAILERVFTPGQHVLEIGCGTGWETLPLARRGVHVLATDVSSEMLERLRRKVAAEGLGSLVEVRKLGAREVPSLLDAYPDASFDGGFSDFGALNCEEDLADLPQALHRLLRPGGRLVLGIWNRFCVSEAFLALVTLRPHRAVARLETPVPVGRSRYGVPVYARGTAEFLERFRPFFDVERITGLPVFVPPYDFARGLAARGQLLPVLRGLDGAFASHFPFNRFGDHFLVELRRRP